jgi:hypothetical protein
MWETTSVRYYYAGPENGSHRAHRPMRVRQHILDDIEGRVCAGRGNQVASFSLLGKAAKRTSIMDIDIAELFYLGLASTGLLALVLRLAFW